MLSLLALLGCGPTPLKFGDTTQTVAVSDDADGDGATADADCDDASASVYPGADELCDDVDQDCDGSVDEEPVDGFEWHLDDDGDGFGDPASQVTACAAPDGYVQSDADCDDTDPAVLPGEREYCDGVDQDCDDAVDENAADAALWYPDDDGDGWGDDLGAVAACEAIEGFSAFGGDCDDSDVDISPAETEICGDGIDNNCDDSGWECQLEGDQPLVGVWRARLTGVSSHDRAGRAVAAGDVDGDGVPDLVVGADDADSGGADAGAVYVLIGPVAAGEAALGAAATQTFTGAEPGDAIGGSLATDDVSANGRDDVLIGAPMAADGAGAVYVTFWPADGSLGDEETTYAVLLGEADEALGTTIATLDQDGDGSVELAVGAPGVSAVHLYTDLTLSGSLLADTPSTELGRAVSAGDLDGDGLDDLLVGSGLSRANGEAWIVLGPMDAVTTADADAALAGEAKGDGAGDAVAIIGDATGDGLPDLLIGAPYHDAAGTDAGAVYLLDGAGVLAGETLVSGTKLLGEVDFDRAGGVIAGAGDVNNDGLGDLLVGGPINDAGGHDAGAVWLIYAPVFGTSGLKEHVSLRGDNAGDAAGTSITAAGDIDSDGYDDFLLGAVGESTAGDNAGAVYLIPGGGF